MNMKTVNTNSTKTTSLIKVNKAETGTHIKDMVREKSDVRFNSIKPTLESDSESDNFFLVRHKKRCNRPNRNDTSNSVPKVVVGSRAPKESKIMANKTVLQKRIFHISNVTKCVASDVVDHLRLSQVDVILCFLALKKRQKWCQAR